jgi:glucose/mannose transport system permease protein
MYPADCPDVLAWFGVEMPSGNATRQEFLPKDSIGQHFLFIAVVVTATLWAAFAQGVDLLLVLLAAAVAFGIFLYSATRPGPHGRKLRAHSYDFGRISAAYLAAAVFGLISYAIWIAVNGGDLNLAVSQYLYTTFHIGAVIVTGVSLFYAVWDRVRVSGEGGIAHWRHASLPVSGAVAVSALLGYLWYPATLHNGPAFWYVIAVAVALMGVMLEMPFEEAKHRLWLGLTAIGLILIANFGPLLGIDPTLLSLLPICVVCGIVGLVGLRGPHRNEQTKYASLPMMFIVLGVFVGGTVWTVLFSFTGMKVFPLFTPQDWYDNYVGMAQYTRLFNTSRWWIAMRNVAIYGVGAVTLQLALGFLIAVLMDQRLKAESVFRTIFLYPFALSFIVTGHVWAWILSPEYGLQKSVRAWGWTSFTFDWVANRDMVMGAIIIAGIWQGTGLVMAMMLAGLRGIDEDIWKASKIDGIPAWRVYAQIVLPMMKPVLVTTFVLVASGAVRIYDLVVALTDGGPGISSDVPSRFIYQNFSANLGQSLAASTVMLLIMAVLLIPWIQMEFGKKGKS